MWLKPWMITLRRSQQSGSLAMGQSFSAAVPTSKLTTIACVHTFGTILLRNWFENMMPLLISLIDAKLVSEESNF